MVLDEPPGACCMFGGVPPCGLVAGAPPVPVESGPVQPWGWSWPLSSGNTVRPVLYGESPGFLSSLWVWAVAIVVQITRQDAAMARRMLNPRTGLLLSKRAVRRSVECLPTLLVKSRSTLLMSNFSPAK